MSLEGKNRKLHVCTCINLLYPAMERLISVAGIAIVILINNKPYA